STSKLRLYCVQRNVDQFCQDKPLSNHPISKPHLGSILCTARVPPQKYNNSQNEDH
ncbi:6557_t:CDS:1, partial [Funneliformis mosseae]